MTTKTKPRKSSTISGILERYAFYFIIYCFLGWIYEMILCFYNLGHYEDRSQLFGPLCPIYGFGALVIVALFNSKSPIRNWHSSKVIQFITVFLGIMIASTILELIGSYVSEALTGGFMWDYSRFKIQYDSRIALFPSFRFAVAGTFVIYAVHPFVDKLVENIGEKARKYGAIAIVLFFVINGLISKLIG